MKKPEVIDGLTIIKVKVRQLTKPGKVDGLS